MHELYWRDPRDGEPWIVRVHAGRPPLLGSAAVPRAITFHHGARVPALIHSTPLEDDALGGEITDADLIELLDRARGERSGT